VLSRREQLLLFCAFGLAFAIKVPMFPLHTWLPDAHVQAPTGGSVILAGGPPEARRLWVPALRDPPVPLRPSSSLGPIIAASRSSGSSTARYCAYAQQDVKKLVAYSSVSHLGFVMLGILSRTEGGIAGSILQMVNHGISTGAVHRSSASSTTAATPATCPSSAGSPR
jgi:NADH-quinone oxidoreductase subunit M